VTATSTRRIAIAAAVVVAVALVTDIADAGPRRQRRSVQIGTLAAPPVVQGLAGAGRMVVLAFTTWDRRRERDADVEVQYAHDWDQNGSIHEDEWRPATEDRLDPRSTRAGTAPFLFASGSEEPVQNAFVWNALADLGHNRFLTLEYALTRQGRPVPDPDNPGSFLFATGPDGITPIFASVKVRMRTLTPRRGHRRTVRGRWINSDAFAVDNALAPTMTIDAIEPGTPLLVHWTAYDADSEDLNGNGQLELADGEDRNGNGVFDPGRIGVAFDFHAVGEDEDPVSMSDHELAALSWEPCTRVVGVGDTDSLDARPGVPVPTTGELAGVPSAPSPVGRHWVFAWDVENDAGPVSSGFLLRATPFDETRAVGVTVYSRTIVHGSN